MKRVVLSSMIIAAAFLSACSESSTTNGGEQEVSTDNVSATTTIAFENEVFDFGTITQGEKVNHVFNFTNTGDADLVIVSAKGSCGCTVPEWPKEPIAPGESGVVKVVFNSEGKKGKQHKRVSIVANTEPATTAVTLKGDVLVPEPDAAPATEELETETENTEG